MKPDTMALFRDSGRLLALNAGTIESIIEAPAVFRVPQLPDGFTGIGIDHDRLIPILNEDMLSGVCGEACGYLVLCRSDYGLVGVPVGEVGQIVENDEGAVEGPGDSEQPGAIGFFRHRGERYPVLDIDLLLESLN